MGENLWIRKKLVETIEEISPSELAESWDNCGFQVDCASDTANIGRVLVSLEITGAVIDEAIPARR